MVTSFVLYHPLFANQELAGPTGFHRIDLDGTVAWPLDAGELLAGMHRHHRRVVRKALREGFETRVARPDSLEDFVAGLRGDDAPRRRLGLLLLRPGVLGGLLASVPLVRSDVLLRGAPRREHARAWGSRRGCTTTWAAPSTAPGARARSTWRCSGSPSGGRSTATRCCTSAAGSAAARTRCSSTSCASRPTGCGRSAVGKALHDPAAYAELTRLGDVDWAGFFPAYRASR